jgi:predicted ATPase
MLRKLRLENFKNFKNAELHLGPFSILIGANATGKSNIRDAFRFLHGIARGYSLPEIFGEKWDKAGMLQWQGIRGGMREITYQQNPTFALEVDFNLIGPSIGTYYIKVEVPNNGTPKIVREAFHDNEGMFFETVSSEENSQFIDFISPSKQRIPKYYRNTTPILPQMIMAVYGRTISKEVYRLSEKAVSEMSSMRFLELNPDAMRQPSFPGQTILTDRGENLSSVLHTICQDPKQKHTLMSYFEELAPTDCKDLDFYQERTGKVLVELLEGDGQRISAYSASDGTLRFLGLLAAMFSPEPSAFYFIEEPENGIHPTRLHLLLDLFERRARNTNIQVVTTTHSPYFLGIADHSTIEDASLVYRAEGTPDGRIQRILDIPDARRLIEKQRLISLHGSGWFETVTDFLLNMEVEK